MKKLIDLLKEDNLLKLKWYAQFVLLLFFSVIVCYPTLYFLTFVSNLYSNTKTSVDINLVLSTSILGAILSTIVCQICKKENVIRDLYDRTENDILNDTNKDRIKTHIEYLTKKTNTSNLKKLYKAKYNETI